MSGGVEALQLKEEDVVKFLAASVHLGASNADFQMENYIYKRKPDGNNIINLKKTWEKLLLAARIIVTIENPADVCVISARPYGQRAILKFASHTGASAVAGRYTPGTFTNQIQAAFREPRLLVVCDPRTDHQSITEASYVNIPVIAFCNTDSPLRHIDVAIPCNNKGPHSVGLMWWMLAREVLRIRGSISRQMAWDVMPDLYFYRDPEEAEKEEQAAISRAAEEPAFAGTEWGGGERAAAEVTEWNPAPAPTTTTDWGAETVTPAVATTPAAPTTEWGTETKEWGAETVPTTTQEWGAEDTMQPSSDWGTSVTMQDAKTAGGADWA